MRRRRASVPPAGPRSRPRRLLRVAARGIGNLLLAGGVAVLLVLAYDLWFTNLLQHRTQHHLATELHELWAEQDRLANADRPTLTRPAALVAPLRTAPEGQGFAILRIPRLGSSYSEVVVEGVGTQDLRRGPGHYPGTALPGQVGNMVISGHRTTYGAPFRHLDALRLGDPLVLQLAHERVTYRVTGLHVVAPSDVAVTLPVPQRPGMRPTRALLTLTTCNPVYSASQRLVVSAQLASVAAE